MPRMSGALQATEHSTTINYSASPEESDDYGLLLTPLGLNMESSKMTAIIESTRNCNWAGTSVFPAAVTILLTVNRKHFLAS